MFKRRLYASSFFVHCRVMWKFRIAEREFSAAMREGYVTMAGFKDGMIYAIDICKELAGQKEPY